MADGYVDLTNLRGPAAKIISVDAVSIPAGEAAYAEMSGPDQGREITVYVPRGFSGLNSVPTDEAMGELLGAPDSDSGTAVQARIDESASPNVTSILGTSSADTAALQLEAYYRSRVASVPSTPVNAWFGYRITDKLKTGVDRVLAGTGPAKILCIGDSTTAGMGSSTVATVANNMAWPAVLSRLIHRNLAPSQYGGSMPPANGHDTEDNRWTLGIGWSRTGLAGIGLGGRRTAWQGNPGSGDLTFLDPRIGADRYDIYFVKGSGTGTITAQVGTGTPVVVATAAATRSIGKITVSGTGVSTSTPVRISNTGASGTIQVIFVEPYRSDDHRIRVANAGVSGSDSSGWLEMNGGDSSWNVLGFLPAYAPDLTIIDLGINDSPGTAVADYVARMQTIASAAVAAGSAVMFKTMVPSAPSSGRFPREAEFVAGLISQSPSRAVLDLFTHYGSYDRNAARGWMADNLHPADALYYDEGEKVAEFLFRYSGHNS